MSKRQDVTPKEAAQRLGVRLDSIYSLIWAGKLEAHKLDGRWLVSADAVEGRLRAKEAVLGTAQR